MNEPYPEQADIETASEDYASRFSGEVGRYFLDVQTSLMLKLVQDFPGASILDVGGGHAQLAVPLVDNGFKVSVTGSSDVCRSRLDQLLPAGSFSYQTCDSLHLPFVDQQFDVVVAVRLLPHVKQWQPLIAEMCRVAGKSVLLDYPDRRSVNIMYDVLFDMKKKMEGNTRTYSMFSRSQLKEEFSKNNFTVTNCKPEFFWPMVLHRKLKHTGMSKALETPAKAIGLTYLFGSPIILKGKAIQPPAGNTGEDIH